MAEETAVRTAERSIVKPSSGETLPALDERRDIIRSLNAQVRAAIDTWPEYQRAVFDRVRETGWYDTDLPVFFERNGHQYGFQRSHHYEHGGVDEDVIFFFRVKQDLPPFDEEKEWALRRGGTEEYYDILLKSDASVPDFFKFKDPKVKKPFKLDAEGYMAELQAARDFADELLLDSPGAEPLGKLVEATVVTPPKSLPANK